MRRSCVKMYRLPVYVLADNDSWGYYRYSAPCRRSDHSGLRDQRMAIPKAKFIFFSSADDLTGTNFHINPAYGRRKSSWMLMSGLTYELNALANKDFQYLTKK